MKLTFTGMADERSFVKEDFSRHGIEDQGAVKFNAKNKFTAEVSDAAGAWLLSDESGLKEQFKDADAQEEVEASLDTGDVESATGDDDSGDLAEDTDVEPGGLPGDVPPAPASGTGRSRSRTRTQ